MVQSRICTYFDSHCKHTTATPTTFLHLPSNLRDRIYRDAGVLNGTSIRIYGPNLPSDLRERTYHPFRPITAATFCLRTNRRTPIFCFTSSLDAPLAATTSFFNLSVASRSVNADMARYLCSHNEMLVCCEDYTGILVLLDLPPHLMRSLRQLSVHLNMCSRHTPKCWQYLNCCHQDYSDYYHGVHGLDSTSKTFQTFIPIWRKVVARLAPLARPDLTLSILCDVGYVDTANLLMDSLREVGLTPSAVRLSRARDAELEEIAQQAVQTRTAPFRSLDLPAELRQAILSFTDLVAPEGKVYCPGGAKFHCVPRWITQYSCPSREFCSLDHAARPHCSCWQPPASMFLVSKAFLYDARATFFSLNRFIVSPTASASMDKPFTASTFLRRQVPVDTLSRLRTLQISFEAALYDFSEYDAHIHRNWVNTIEYVASRLRKLSLHLVFGHGPLRVVNPSLPEHFPGWQKELFRMHEQIVRPLRKLKCLDRFSVDVGSPYDRVPIDGQLLRDHEAFLEGLVMEGKDGDIARVNN